MEIGGFITSGAEIVNHNNTLSGNGTVESPLGVVPGYNETVLWSGAYNSTVSSITLSEPTTNFESVKVYWQHQTAEKPAFEYAGDSQQWYAIGGRYATPNNVPCVFQCFWSGNYTKYDMKFCNYQFGSLTAAPQAANELVPIKVVGINRKAQ